MQHIVGVCDGFFNRHRVGWWLVMFFAVPRRITGNLDRIGRMLESLEIMLRAPILFLQRVLATDISLNNFMQTI